MKNRLEGSGGTTIRFSMIKAGAANFIVNIDYKNIRSKIDRSTCLGIFTYSKSVLDFSYIELFRC